MAGESRLRLVASDESSPELEPLMRKVALGDRDAFAAVFDALSGAVYGVALRVARDPALAEEIAQETFLDVWRRATRYDPARASVRTWVTTIAHRRAVDVVRSSEAARRRDAQSIPEVVSHEEAAEKLIADEEQSQVRDCMDTLTDIQQESIRLAYYSGYTYPEVATLLEKPLPTIKTRMRDGLIRLRDCLEAAL